jgi:hypothetical protein
MTTDLLFHTVVDHEIQRRLRAADDERVRRLARRDRRWTRHPLSRISA